MAGVSERIGSLGKYRVAWYEPQNDRVVHTQQLAHGVPCGIAAEQGLPAPRRHANADVGHFGIESRCIHRHIGLWSLKRALGHLLESRFRSLVTRCQREELAQRFKDTLLVVLECDHHATLI